MSAEPVNLWERTASQPVFVLTSDQDWAPEWAIERFLDRVEPLKIPLHVFRTNPSPLLDAAVRVGKIDQGWHPNFLPGSTQGASIEEVLEYCRKHFPGARTVRSHCYAEDTFRWQALAAAGMTADSQFGALFQAHLMPQIHFTGIVRLPVYFSDDVFYQLTAGSLAVDAVLATLFQPGLKIFNFHPTFVGCNTPSREHHDRHRSQVFGSSAPEPGVIFEGRGTSNVLDELLGAVLAAGHRFMRFESLAEEFARHFRRTPGLSGAPAYLGEAGSEWFRTRRF